MSKLDVTYWAKTAFLAAMYVSMKHVKPADIVVFEAPISAFDTSKLSEDSNYMKGHNPGSYEYRGDIPPECLKQVSFLPK